jgi:hypothetical protein
LVAGVPVWPVPWVTAMGVLVADGVLRTVCIVSSFFRSFCELGNKALRGAWNSFWLVVSATAAHYI